MVNKSLLLFLHLQNCVHAQLIFRSLDINGETRAIILDISKAFTKLKTCATVYVFVHTYLYNTLC